MSRAIPTAAAIVMRTQYATPAEKIEYHARRWRALERELIADNENPHKRAAARQALKNLRKIIDETGVNRASDELARPDANHGR